MSREINGETFLTTDEVGQNPEFGWSRDTIYRAAREGRLEGQRFFGDRKTYWKLSELRELISKPSSIIHKSLARDSA